MSLHQEFDRLSGTLLGRPDPVPELKVRDDRSHRCTADFWWFPYNEDEAYENAMVR